MSSHTLLSDAYHYCQSKAKHHYENFPVASTLLPKSLRNPISAIYTFARTADDFADEGKISDTLRLEKLDNFRQKILQLETLDFKDDPLFLALQDTHKTYQLPKQLFLDLISAFQQDVTKKRYNTYKEVLDYCQRSANPVGRLLLYMTNNASSENLKYSDCICSGLQLINFLQDWYFDLTDRNRCYFSLEELKQFNLTPEDLFAQRNNETVEFKTYMNTQLAKIDKLYQCGKPLVKRLKGLFGFEIRLIYFAGNKTLHKLKIRDHLIARPTLHCFDYPGIFIKSLR